MGSSELDELALADVSADVPIHSEEWDLKRDRDRGSRILVDRNLAAEARNASGTLYFMLILEFRSIRLARRIFERVTGSSLTIVPVATAT